MIKEEIIKQIQDIVKQLGVEENIKIVLDHPKDASFGDYSSNIAMAIFSNSKLKTQNSKLLASRRSGQLKIQNFKTPLELAQEIASSVKRLASSSLGSSFDKVEVAPPGFINFWISQKALFDTLLSILQQKDAFGKGSLYKGKKVMVEFTDPNPFKEFHIGHLYSNTVGESLARLFEFQRGEVRRVNYQGDVGMHVAKSLYGIGKKLDSLDELDGKTPQEKAKFLGEAYAIGAKAYEEDEDAKLKIQSINKKVYEDDSSILELWKKGREWSLEYFESIYKRLGTKFEDYYFEKNVGEIGLELVKEYQKKGVFEESEGAIIFPGEKYGLHNRVFINSLGLPTYEAKELGLNKKKYEDYPFDFSIIVTGNEINEYFKVLFLVMQQVISEVAAKTKHLGHGMVRLPQGKMSSRTGNVITGEWLLDEAKGKILEAYKDMEDVPAEKVAVGAIKYALLKSGIGRDIEFNFDESISFEGNSGPYLQYTFARTQSLLTKMQMANGKWQMANHKLLPISHKLESEELALLRLLYRFPEVLEEATVELSPAHVCSYLFDVAHAFNHFYQKHKILDSVILGSEATPESDSGQARMTMSDKSMFRLALTDAVGIVLKNGLHVLGIGAPERM